MVKPPRMRDNLRALPRSAWILCAGSFVNRFGSFVFVFLILYLRSEGYSPGEAGIAVAAYGIGSIFSSVGGFLADRIGRRETIALSMFLSATSMVALSQARGIFLITLLTGIAGMASEMYRPASSALLTDLVDEPHRVTAFAAYRLAINAGFALGPAVAGFLAERSFLYLFLGDAATSVVLGLVALTVLPRSTPSAPEEERRGEILRAVLADSTFLIFLAASLVSGFVYFQGTTTFALEVTADGLSRATYGALISLNGLLIVLIELPITSVTQRLEARAAIAAGMALVGIGFGLTAFADSFVALAATVVIWTLGEIVAAPMENAYVSRIAPVHLRGRYHAVWGLTFSLALVLAPSVGTRLYDWSGDGFWLLCGALGIAAGGLVMLGRKQEVQPTLAVPEAGPELPGIET